MIDYLRSGGPMRVHNTSGEIVPPFAAMEMQFSYESGRSATFLRNEELYTRIRKPTSAGEENPLLIVFNGPDQIQIDGYGVSWLLPRMLVLLETADGDADPGDDVGPVDGEWHLSVDGSGFECVGYDSGMAYENGTVRTVFIATAGGGGGGFKIVQTPVGGIAARSGTTISHAMCTEFKNVSGTLTTNTRTFSVYNLWPFAIPGSLYIGAKKEQLSSSWIAMHPGVMDVRWNLPDLEQTRDMSTYIDIDNAEPCT